MSRKSVFWQFFSKTPKGEKCLKCNEIVQSCGNTTNIARHLKNHHPKEYNEVKSNGPNDPKQPRIDDSIAVISSFKDGENKANVDVKLIWFLVKCGLPFSIVDSYHFKDFCKFLNSHYEPPGRKKVVTLMNTLANNKKENMKHHMKFMKWFCLTCDSWKDTLNQRKYLGVTMYFFDDYQPMSICLNANEFIGPMTANAIYDRLIQILDEWDIPKDKIIAVVTDGGSNFVSAAKKFNLNIHCVAHKINLIVTNAIDGNPDLTKLISQVRSIVTHFKQNSNMMQDLRDEKFLANQPDLKPIQDVSTRWNSTFLMIDRYIELQCEISMVLIKHNKRDLDLDINQLRYLADIHLLLKPFYEMTSDLSGEKYVTISRVIPLISNATLYLDKLNISTDIGRSLKQRLNENMNDRFGKIESETIYTYATLLDPRFKKVDFQSTSDLNASIMSLNNILTEVQTTQIVACEKVNDSSIWALHDRRVQSLNDITSGMHSGLQHYLELPVLSRNEDPLSFWKKNKETWPQLHDLAMKFLTIQATSVPSERLFSMTGQIISERRNRIKPKNVDALAFLDSLPINYI